jgi:hypothetical protein
MKKVSLFFAGFLLSMLAVAQAPNQFNYQAAMRDASGNPLKNQNVSLRISILQGSTSGTALYVETHTLTSNSAGIVTAAIGGGSVVSGSMAAIVWESNSHFVKVEADPAGGSNYATLSNSKLLSVPYSLSAARSTKADSADYVANVDDADADPSNEIQALSLANDVITLSKGGGTADLTSYNNKINNNVAEINALKLKRANDSVAVSGQLTTLAAAVASDFDKDSTNELQSLNASNDTLYLSKNGGFVVFGPISTPWTKTATGIYYDKNVSIGSTSLDYPLYIADTLNHTNTSVYANALHVNASVTNSSGASYGGIFSEVKGSQAWNTAVDGTSNGVSTGTNYGIGGYAYNANTNVGMENWMSTAGKINYGVDATVRNGSENYGVHTHVRPGSTNAEENVGVHAELQSTTGFGRAIWAQSYGAKTGEAMRAEAASDTLNFGINGYALSKTANTRYQLGIGGFARGDFNTSNGVGTGTHVGVLGESRGAGTYSIGVVANGLGTGALSTNRAYEGFVSSSQARYNQGLYLDVSGAGNGSGTYNSGLYSLVGGNTNENYGAIFANYGQGITNFGLASYAYGAISGAKTNMGAYLYAASSDTNIASYAIATSSKPLNVAVYGEAQSGTTNFGGYFIGNLLVTGNLQVTGSIAKGSGTFKIDHPADPANKYLVHSFVESPDMMNVYNGNVVTDDRGFASVSLPEYFESANKDVRYQLTVIGTFAQAIIAEEVKSNTFVIQTDKPNVKVSWQVTGIRDDPYAREHRIMAEQDKPEPEKGTYLHPELHGQPASKALYKPLNVKPRESVLLREGADSQRAHHETINPDTRKETGAASAERLQQREAELKAAGKIK